MKGKFFLIFPAVFVFEHFFFFFLHQLSLSIYQTFLGAEKKQLNFCIEKKKDNLHFFNVALYRHCRLYNKQYIG